MFTWLNKQGVQHASGFIVQFTGRFSAEYRDSGKVVTIYVEAGFSGGLQCIIIEPDAFDRWDGGIAIELSDREQMFKNFRDALEFQDLKLVVERGESPFN